MLVPLRLNLDAPSGLVIVSQPQPVSVLAGAPVTFSVVAVQSSMGAINYQWLVNNTVIAGANGPTYTIANALATQNGQLFSVVVSDTFGDSIASAQALLTVIGGIVSTVVLSTYLNDVRLMLHDPNGAMWPDAELTNYINQARHRVCQDTKCLRQVITPISIAQGQELYVLNAILPSVTGQIIDVLNIMIYYGNQRYPLQYMPFSYFSSRLRQWQLYQSRPIAWTRMGATAVYVGPIPDQNYTSDWDVSINCVDLVNDFSLEQIPVPFNEPVKYWACYLAKFKEQALGEAQIFKKEYVMHTLMVSRAFQTRILPDVYAG